MYLAPCKKAKGLEIFFLQSLYNVGLFLPISRQTFTEIHTRDYFLTYGVTFKHLLLERDICWKPIFVMLHIGKMNLEPYYMPKYDLVT